MNSQDKINELEKLIETVKTNTEENINKLTEEINKLKEVGEIEEDKIEVTKDNCLELSYPKKNEIYYFINGLGEVDFTKWDNYSTDIIRLSIGNVFKTREEAELELQYRLLSAKIMAYAKLKGYLLSEEEVRDVDVEKHFIYYDIEEDNLMETNYRYSNMINGLIRDLYINSYENAREIIKVFKDELLDYCRSKWGVKGE